MPLPTRPVRATNLRPGDVFIDPSDPSRTDPITFTVTTAPAPAQPTLDPVNADHGRWTFDARGSASGTTRTHATQPDFTFEVLA